MNEEIELIREIDKKLTVWNRIYGEFGNKNNLNNVESAILYTLLLFNKCTQNDIVNDYLLPKQTVNNIILKWQDKGFVTLEQSQDDRRRKIITLTSSGRVYANDMLKPLYDGENVVAKKLGKEKLSLLLSLVSEMNQELKNAFEDDKKWFIHMVN